MFVTEGFTGGDVLLRNGDKGLGTCYDTTRVQSRGGRHWIFLFELKVDRRKGPGSPVSLHFSL